jgi:septum formation protein
LDKASDPIWNKKVQYPWQDKAGGYGIQDPFGALAVTRINGDYYNVMGLPISRLYQVLKTEFGLEL